MKPPMTESERKTPTPLIDALFRCGVWLIEGETVPSGGAVISRTYEQMAKEARQLERALATATQRAEALEAERDALRAKSRRQRMELRRANRRLRDLWDGARFSANARAALADEAGK